jgi:hypothetical protein
MTMHRSLAPFGLAILLAMPSRAGAQSGTYVLRAGTDTVAVEKFNRTPGRLETETSIPSASIRQKTVIDLTPDLAAVKLVVQVWQLTDSAGQPPRRTATLQFTGDSVIATSNAGGADKVNRFKSAAHALPYANPSMAMVALLLERSDKDPGAAIPLFILGGGSTVDAHVKRIGSDSAVVTMAGGEMRLKLGGGGLMSGTMGGNLTFDRSAGPVTVKVEKPDYSAPPGAPYTAEEVRVTTPMGHTLAGTLTLPKGASKTHPVPAIATITGSGLEDRDEAIPAFKGYRPFRQIADTLGRRGIAVLRMDDRGFGESGGDGNAATSADFAQDISAGLAYLRTRSEVDGSRLGLVGHSEGGLIAPLVAKQEGPALKGIVLLAGTAYTGRQIMLFQLSNGVEHNKELTPAKRDSLLKNVPAQIDSQAAHQPWMKFFLDYEPLATARVVKTPVLILNGATDQQVTPDQVPLLEKAFKEASNPDVTAKVFPEMNHLFVHDPDGFPGRYNEIKNIRVEPEVLGTVADWLVKRLGARPIP